MIVCLSYKRKPWSVRYREPWSGKPRQKAFATEQEAQDFEGPARRFCPRERNHPHRATPQTPKTTGPPFCG